jgi:ATP-dependent RNA helicase RhlE
MRQGLRQKVLRNFRDGGLQALIATDVAARGIDVAGLSHVVNFDITDTPEAYVHRIGRTGRAGLGGLAISFCAPSEESQLAAIISVVGARVELFDLDGKPVTDFQAKPAPRKRGRGSRTRREQPATQRRTPKDAAAKAKSEGRTAKRKWGQSTDRDGEWSPLESAKPKKARAGGDGPNNRRDETGRTGQKQRGKPFGKPSGKPTGNRAKQDKNAQNKFAENKFASGKSRHDKTRTDRGDQAPARHGGQGGKRPQGKLADNGNNPFAKNPFAKKPSGTQSRADGKPATRDSRPGSKSGAKPGNKHSGKPRAGNKPASRTSRRPTNSRGGEARLKRRG